MSGEGHNSGINPELQRRAQRRIDALDAIAKQQELLKVWKTEDKADGYEEKAIAHVIKELRGGPDKQAANLELEDLVDTYRRGLGLPTTLEAAQAEQRKSVETIPDKPKRPRANGYQED